ncbi:MAG TPA: hypothetical protein VFS52_22250 [Steroidobacteraceae bacterium]|jgi:hypothetical protein|nr:hypothetical protein [Steroidobacteraceae bacterium]
MQATQTITPDLSKWVRSPRVSIDFRESYGLDLLAAPYGGRPQFKLMPKYLVNGDGEEVVVQFNLTFEDGRMLPNWEELLFTPLGSVPPTLSGKLPPWNPENAPIYSKMLDPLIVELYRNDTNLQRLDANIPLFLDHSPESRRQLTIDRVRMVFLEDVVDAPNPNFVLLVFSYLDGYKVMQNGAGGGPPER